MSIPHPCPLPKPFAQGSRVGQTAGMEEGECRSLSAQWLCTGLPSSDTYCPERMSDFYFLFTEGLLPQHLAASASLSAAPAISSLPSQVLLLGSQAWPNACCQQQTLSYAQLSLASPWLCLLTQAGSDLLSSCCECSSPCSAQLAAYLRLGEVLEAQLTVL